MPWTKAKCPNGREVPLDDCLKCQDECLDIEIRKAVFREIGGEYPLDRISASSLTGCLRESWLTRIHGYAMSPQSGWFLVRGKLLHKLIEADEPQNGRVEVLKEFNMKVTTPWGILRGRLDYYGLVDRLLKDWKSTGDFGLEYTLHDGAKEEHAWQANIYAYMLRKKGYEPAAIEIVYITMMNIVKTGHVAEHFEYAFNPPKAQGKRKNMVGAPELVKTYASGRKKWKCRYRLPEVEIYTDKKVERFLKPKMEAWNEALRTGKWPPKPKKSIQDWKCEDYCGVNEICRRGQE